ncbi:DNA-directed RNA polymerase subunit beta [Candidatus Giovannonibacteria bacterium RIFCSPHIGHO2_01_FULL_45_24]|uniref:DNA-directed RNA polymerase subunit beta n=1 Tax=Candidatus Giovannonibacteria bacterium RIFCSPLOWO2_01_FULL_46_32 TaxID=1798353 RepID=A0A1F5XHA6_9BACT|nr:MAG: DNA-directed RNA polymerase subunit beta [Candidatus Giovannonibacteria bacterium RIFCSPHIGHO2_01_FULL_45_24]OGF87250.1 MAG: DNA-directed RNA polymerase subunit beta [Candidatus Giovannonibacteria bacterium RIFCSPLOWO2_01_FULL_46_32]
MPIQKKYFSRYREPLANLPNLAEMQLKSFNWLLKTGIREILDEFSPIVDYTGEELVLEFLDYSFDEPKYDENYARVNNLSFESSFRIRIRLTNKRTGEKKEQEIFLADMPMMTPRGTFLINGVERVIVSQLARSFGAYFTLVNVFKGRKLFGAKVIPSRGAWLEFETESDGAIYAKVDRKRKIAATALMRIFGLEKNDEIINAFSAVDNGEVSFIKKTLEKDPTKTADDSYVEIFKRIRQGELATPDNARELIGTMFGPERYDLSAVGRYKLGQRLLSLAGVKVKNPRILNKEDLVAILSEVISLNNNPLSLPDDIDNLGNRRVRSVGEMLQQRLRIGLARMERTIKDRMSTSDLATITPAQLLNARPFAAVISEFFMTNQLSQFMDQTNILSELEHKRRVSALGPGGLTRERSGFEVRDVHPSYYGRLCPIMTPEGPNIGLINYLAGYALVNDFGILETPYRKVINGKVTNEINYLTAFEEARHKIAQAGVAIDTEGNILDEETEGRSNGQPALIAKSEIDYIDVSPQQAFSIATSLVPFLEHDDSTRAMMGSNMQRQAVPCVRPQAPLVATGMEEKAARDSGRLIISDMDGAVSAVDAKSVTVKFGRKEKTYELVNFVRSNQSTVIHQRPSVKLGDKIKKGDVLADTSLTDRGHLALGQNLLVAFLSWGGANFEDAIILSDRLVKNDTFTSVLAEDYTVDVRDTKLGSEITTHDIPNVGEEKLKDLDEDGIICVGAEVRAGDILVGKISPKGESDLTPEERLLRAIFGEKARDVKDTSFRLQHGRHGRVVGIKVFSREKGDKLETGVIKEIRVEVAEMRKVSPGDKLAGRHGNKGVISRILPQEDMPYLADGTPVDVILNPLGVASRMNIGQILETHLGWAAEKQGYMAITPTLLGATETEIKSELKKAGLPEDGKVRLFDGRTGKEFDQKVTVGMVYLMKLSHMVEDKLHMRSIGPYSLITQQPLGGKAQGGGQRFGEMEVWALEGYGAAHTLQEMLTIKSDDVLGRASAYDAIVRGEPFRTPNVPASFHVLVNELKGLALDVELRGVKEAPEDSEEYAEKAQKSKGRQKERFEEYILEEEEKTWSRKK